MNKYLILLCILFSLSAPAADWEGSIAHVLPGAIGCKYLSQLRESHAFIMANDVAGLGRLLDTGGCVVMHEQYSVTVITSIDVINPVSHRVVRNGVSLWFRARDMKCCWKLKNKKSST